LKKLNRNKTEVIFAGAYNSAEKLSGSEKVAKRLFDAYTQNHKSVFIDYFLDGKKYGVSKKLFGHDLIKKVNGSPVLKLGIFQLILTVLKYKPKIVHLITYERFYSVLFFLRPFLGYKIIYNVHGIRVLENEINGLSVPDSLRQKDKSCEKLYFIRADKLLFLSQSSVDLASQYYQFDKTKIEIIKNGVDEIFHKVSESKPTSDNLKIVFVGEVVNKLKGFDFLYSSLQILNFPVELFIVSDSNISFNKAENIKSSFSKRMNTIDFANFLKDKNVYVSASENDSFSITAVECMSAGLIPILTKQTGSSELVQNNVNGFVINFNDENTLINVLTELNENTDLQNKISGEAKKIYNSLRWNKICEKYVQIYERLI
jgi:glycosyltransferase involved in cell wall biosynthesis